MRLALNLIRLSGEEWHGLGLSFSSLITITSKSHLGLRGLHAGVQQNAQFISAVSELVLTARHPSSQQRCSLEGEHKDVVDSLQKDFRIGEAGQLEYAQDPRIAVFQLPAEILSDVFLYLVESGLEYYRGDMSFASWTFNFLQVCKRWNKVAIGFHRLWVWWVAGAVEAWPLFNIRSKGAPIFLTWRPELPGFTRDVLADTKTPRKIRQLDLHGTREELEHILGAIGSDSTSTTSSIRVAARDQGQYGLGDRLTRFFSSPFPKLSHLDIRNFLPDSASSVFTTSNLTSLKLDHIYRGKGRYTRSQFSQILQWHPNLQKLDLGKSAMPPVEGSRAPAPVILPRLVDLTLFGMEAIVVGFLGLISMASPLHNVIIILDYTYTPRLSTLTRTTKTILVPYYECQELEYPRKVDHLTVSKSDGRGLVFSAVDRPTPAPHPTCNLTLQFQFHGIGEALVSKAIRVLPLKGVRELTVMTLSLSADDWRGMFREMEDFLHLRLDSLPIEPVLDALDLAPKLQSLTLRNLDVLFERYRKLLDVLEERRNHHIGLESLAVERCRMPPGVCEVDLRDRVERVTWNDVTVPAWLRTHSSWSFPTYSCSFG